MDKNVPLHLQEIVFSSSAPAVSRAISDLVKRGKLVKIVPRLFTPNLDEPHEVIVRRNLFKIIGGLYPGALLSHRSALEYKPTGTGNMFLTYTYDRRINLPGITLNFMKGPGPLSSDITLGTGLYASQPERALLENLQETRKTGGESKTLVASDIESRLEQVIQAKGETGLNALRETARTISNELNMGKEFDKLNRMVGALLNTKPSEILTSPVAQARAFGNPYDARRVSLFEELFAELQQRQYTELPEQNITAVAYRRFAFFEAYFSNFIEGTKFSLEEATGIIDSGKPMDSRDEDSHDILGTYQIVSNPTEMKILPSSPDDLLRILQYRHRIMLSARPTKNPGDLKDRNNRAGDTEFVDHSLVKGTLHEGFKFYQALKEPFARAAYMMFMISEIHPFLDGNGRIARVMMNAELSAGSQTKIIIPTVFREDYLGALRQLTRQQQPDSYIRMLQRAQKFSATLVGEDINQIRNVLELSFAFKESDDHILKIVNE